MAAGMHVVVRFHAWCLPMQPPWLTDLRDRAKVCGHANDLVCVTLTAKDVAAPGDEPFRCSELAKASSIPAAKMETKATFGHVAEISGPYSCRLDLQFLQALMCRIRAYMRHTAGQDCR